MRIYFGGSKIQRLENKSGNARQNLAQDQGRFSIAVSEFTSQPAFLI